MPQSLYPLILIEKKKVFKNWKIRGLQKFRLTLGDRAIIMCLLYKITLFWSIYRNIFQPMDYAASLVDYGAIKKYLFDLF